MDWKSLGEMIIALAEQGRKMQQEEQAAQDTAQTRDSMWRDEHERGLRAEATLGLVQRRVEELCGRLGMAPSNAWDKALHPSALDVAAEMSRLEESGR